MNSTSYDKYFLYGAIDDLTFSDLYHQFYAENQSFLSLTP